MANQHFRNVPVLPLHKNVLTLLCIENCTYLTNNGYVETKKKLPTRIEEGSWTRILNEASQNIPGIGVIYCCRIAEWAYQRKAFTTTTSDENNFY